MGVCKEGREAPGLRPLVGKMNRSLCAISRVLG